MSMFDEIDCHILLPHIPAPPKDGWYCQTKSFARTMDHYEIQTDGRLFLHVRVWTKYSSEDVATMPMLKNCMYLKRTGHTVPVMHRGIIQFMLCDTRLPKKYWKLFAARLVHGKIVDIWRP